jgi:hypothetical protein
VADDPLRVYVYDVAPTPPVQLTVNPDNVIEENVKEAGCVGAVDGVWVVTEIGEDGVEPEALMAVTMIVYDVDCERELNVAEVLVEEDGVAGLEFRVYE